MNDYLEAQSQLQGRLLKYQIQWPNYFSQCYRAMRDSESLGVEMHEELAEWQRALATQPPDVQLAVQQMLANQGMPNDARASKGMMQGLAALLKSPRAERCLKSWYRGKIMRDPEWRFQSVIEYLEWEDTTPGISR